jgi:GxxExxY protein
VLFVFFVVKNSFHPMDNIETIATQIVDATVKVHKVLGQGLLESTYQACLAYELTKRGLIVECKVIQPIEYDGLKLDAGYRVDMLVENCIIIENKCVEKILPIHMAQILTYLKLRNCKLGFIINWHMPLIKDGIKRVVN